MKQDINYVLVLTILILAACTLVLNSRLGHIQSALAIASSRNTVCNEALATIRNDLARANDLLTSAFGHEVPVSFEMNHLDVTATAYTAREEECDSTPWVTADGTPSRVGVLAVSRDLLAKYGLRMGQRVIVEGFGLFEIRDKMNARYTKRIDLLHANLKAAKRFSPRSVRLTWIMT